jgi:predicted amidohydrolase
MTAAVLLGPGGLVGKYRKNHLPFLGVDRFLDPGDKPFTVYKTAIGNIGIHICYDCNFPESARVMMLLGADILALPTNWPEGRGKMAKYVVIARAYENKVHLAAFKAFGASPTPMAWSEVYTALQQKRSMPKKSNCHLL